MNRTNTSKEFSLRTLSLFTGIGLLAMALIAPIVYFQIFPSLFIVSDLAATIANLKVSVFSLRLGIFLFLVVAWGLFLILRPLHYGLSLLAVCFRLVYAVLLVVALQNLLSILPFVENEGFVTSVCNTNVCPSVLHLYESFQSFWDFSLLLFGIHLFLVGLVFLFAKQTSKIIGVFVVVAGLGYSVDAIGKLLVAGYNWEVAMFTFIGEVVLIGWLFYRSYLGFEDFNTT
ncbi:DUF4386 domain-containing protein [Leptospira sp. WS39.C2]